MNHKNQSSIMYVTSTLLVFVLTLFGTQSYAQTYDHIMITNPPSNGIVSSGFEITGTYQSTLAHPVILIELNNVNYTANVSNGIFTYTTSIPDGTYNMIIYLLDNSATYRTSVQFNQISNHITPTKYALIIPYYGESCQRMIDQGDYSVCPPLSALMKRDTSNQAISGHFVLKKDGTYIREKPEVPNHFDFYNNMSDKKVCVDCYFNLDAINQVQQVIIEANGFSFTTHEFTTVTQNNTGVDVNGKPNWYITNTNENSAGIVVHHDWYADDSCNTVTIDYSKERYDDAIDYLKSGCTSYAYNSTTITPIPNHPFSLTSPYSSLAEDAYKQQIFNGHKDLTNERMPSGGGLGPGNCINKLCNFTDPYHKKGY